MPSTYPQITASELLGVLQHALGLDEYGGGTRTRNHFVTGAGSRDHALCLQLLEQGLMVSRGATVLTGGDDCFCVTEAGLEHLRTSIPRPEKKRLTRSQRNYPIINLFSKDSHESLCPPP